MKIEFFKYEGTGNDFIIIDNRNNLIEKYSFIKNLCNRKYGVGADGLIIIENDKNGNIYMKYFNSDGKESTMCGNGGRCLIYHLSKINKKNREFLFYAIDGIHYGFVKNSIIYIKMINILINNIIYNDINHNIFINTGSPHYVMFIDNNIEIEDINVYNEGKKIRDNNIYDKNGVNVNFVKVLNDGILQIRTYERGVENETLSCGTGVIASTISSDYLKKIKKNNIKVLTKGGVLNVSFNKNKKYYENIWLSGPVNLIFQGIIDI